MSDVSVRMLVELITGPRCALEGALADAVRQRHDDDPLLVVHVVVGEPLLRSYLRRRVADLLDGHLNVPAPNSHRAH